MERKIVFMREIKLIYVKHGLWSPTTRFLPQKVVSILRIGCPRGLGPEVTEDGITFPHRHYYGAVKWDVKDSVVYAFLQHTGRPATKLFSPLVQHARHECADLQQYFQNNPNDDGVVFNSLANDKYRALKGYIL